MSLKEYSRRIREGTKAMKSSKWKKNQIIDKILHEFWTQGLNLLQLAHIDCQLIVDNPNAYFWVSSVVKDSWGNEVPLLMDPASFLYQLARHLAEIFMCYIYVCTHPEMPLVIIRVQVFDLLPSLQRRKKSERPHITSHKPFFLAIPMNSPNVIHTPGNDLVADTVLQVVENSLPQDPRNVLRLERSKLQKAVRSLESMHILKGNSRFANSMGAWALYADGVADVSPLAHLDEHLAKAEQSKIEVNGEKSTEKLANIRFKGSVSGKIQSARLFDSNEPVRSKKRANNDEEERRTRPRNEFRSIAPIRYAEFELQEKFEDDDEPSHVVVKLVGTDVFAGLHELAVKNDQVVDPKIVPGWLTGEEGLSCGIVRNGKFQST